MKKIVCYTSGDSRGNPGPAGIGVRILDENKDVVTEVSKSIGNSTKTSADYVAVARCLAELQKHYADETSNINFEICLESEFVHQQLSHQSQIKDISVLPYFIDIHNLRIAHFPHIKFTLMKQGQNPEVQNLARAAIDRG